jgi:hypothetical protein
MDLTWWFVVAAVAINLSSAAFSDYFGSGSDQLIVNGQSIHIPAL